jgi:hypothetical protein
MAEQRDIREADRFAAGRGRTDTDEAREDEIMPGFTGGGTNYVPPAGPADAAKEKRGHC